MPGGAELRIGTIRGIPLYDGGVKATEGIPKAVTNLKDAIAAADGLLLVTPEYNNSMPAARDAIYAVCIRSGGTSCGGSAS
jgi:chromate reductase, NAD(P)H dehydrogenase (quinone)